MPVEYHRRFLKRFRTLQPSIKSAFYERLNLFFDDKYHPILNNYVLTGRYAGKRSFNVTGDYRAIFRELDDRVVVYTIGTHSELYGK